MKIPTIKIERWLAISLCAVVAAMLFALPAFAQEDRDYRSERDARDRERELKREQWKQKFDLEGYLNKLDDDKSGVLESKELKSDRTRQHLARLGINADNPVRIDVAIKKANAVYANKRDAERKKFADQVGPKLDTFGIEKETIGLEGFGFSDAKEPAVASFEDSITGLKKTDFDEQTLNDARKMLNGYDRDKSGFLEGDEIGRIRWKDPKPAESDLNSDGRISLLEMAQRLQNKNDARAARDRGNDRRNRDYGRSDREDDQRDRDYGRSRRPDRGGYGRTSESSRASTKASSSGRSSQGGSKSGSPANSAVAFANYIDGVYKKYDTDGDNRLSKAELKKMRRPLKGDANSDGFLSKKEATDYIKGDKGKKKDGLKATATNNQNQSRGGPANVASRKYTPPKKSGARNSGSRGGANSRSTLGSLDKNSDGQIQMAEFSSTWDEATLQKFRKTDKDEDGIISADEWAARPK